MSELKNRFLSIYKELVTRDGADAFLTWLDESDFFVAPASTRFHGCHEEGLLEHSLNVYDCLKKNVERANLQDTYSPETIAVVSLLHDICKVNYYKKGFRNVKDDETMAWEMLNKIAQSGVIYFAFNTRINECKNHHGFIGTDHCPVCGEPVFDTYQRIVGYLVPSRAYSKDRFREFNTRQWYSYAEAMSE